MHPNFSKYKLGHVTLKTRHLYMVQTSPFPHSIQNMNQRVSEFNKLLKMTTTHISPICVYPRHPSCYPDFALVLFAPELRTYPHFSRTSKTQQEILVINNTSSIDKLKNQRKSVLFYEKLQKNQALVLYEKHEISTLRVDTETLVNRRVL